MVTERLTTWIDERRLPHRALPERWTGMLWQVTVHSFIIVALTGVFLMFFYDPS